MKRGEIMSCMNGFWVTLPPPPPSLNESTTCTRNEEEERMWKVAHIFTLSLFLPQKRWNISCEHLFENDFATQTDFFYHFLYSFFLVYLKRKRRKGKRNIPIKTIQRDPTV